MLYELSHTQGGLLPEIAHLLQWIETSAPVTHGLVSGGSYPQINTGVTEECIDVSAIVAGVNPESLDVSIADNILTISGEREVIKPEGDNTTILLNEIDSGQFKRAVTLPEDVDSSQVEANYRDGILQISIQRKEHAKTRRIAINTH
jgi:HSP20 family protein